MEAVFNTFLLLTLMVQFTEIYVFLPLSRVHLLVTKRVYPHLEKPKFQEVSLSKLYSIFTGNNVLDAPLLT
jgi:hypothetical protein